MFFYSNLTTDALGSVPGNLALGRAPGSLIFKRVALGSEPEPLDRSITREWNVSALVNNPLSTHFYGQS